MMLVSKLSNSFELADYKVWLKGSIDLVDPILLGRLASLAKHYNLKMEISAGYRSYATQARLYEEYLQYKRTGKLGPNGVKLAAQPGKSFHEIHLAVDVKTAKYKALTNKQILPFGLIKPISSENWHIQPIECTSGVTSAAIIDKYRPREGTKGKMKYNFDSTLMDVNNIFSENTNYGKARDIADGMNKHCKKLAEHGLEVVVSYDSKNKCPKIEVKEK